MVLEAVGMSYAARTFALRFARTPVYIYTLIYIFLFVPGTRPPASSSDYASGVGEAVKS